MTETNTKKRLLEVRKTIKDRKPEFKQQNSGRKARVGESWRRPRGLQSKMRHKFKGYPIMVSSGWRSPVEVRGLDRKGNDTVMVYNVADLEKVGKHQAALIAGTVGNKKRLAIIEKAEQMNILVVNIKTDKFKAKIAKSKEDKDKVKAEKSAHKKKTLEDSLKKADKDKKDKENKSKKAESAEASEEIAEEQKAEEKKQKDDVLIHKD